VKKDLTNKVKSKLIDSATSSARVKAAPIQLRDLKGMARPVSSKNINLTIRLSGDWLDLWRSLQGELSDFSDSEIVRQALAMRAALVAVDAQGNPPTAYISYVGDNGEKVTEDLEEHVGLKPAVK
jgi:hypothetical protein